MGIGVVLIFYSIALAIVATVGGVVLGFATHRLTRKASAHHKRATTTAALFPFMCVFFAGTWFVAYWFINATVFHRDPALGDTWETPLPNGYALMMIDTTDQGTVYNPRTQTGTGLVTSNADTVFGVRLLQVSGNLIFGASDTGYFSRIGEYSNLVDSYFELDTVHNTRKVFQSLDQLRIQATADRATLNLRPFASVFDSFRYTWFDFAALALLLIAPCLGFITLARRIFVVRKLAENHPA